MPTFLTKTGRLTRYALACGYVETNAGARLSIPSPSTGVLLVTSPEGGALYNGRNLKHARAVFDNAHRLPLRDDVQTLTYHRPPTPSELRFGEGATHYRDFSPDECCHPGTRIDKRWILADDGLRYYR